LRIGGRSAEQENADPVDPLRLGGERRGEEAESDSLDEGSAIHYSIT